MTDLVVKRNRNPQSIQLFRLGLSSECEQRPGRDQNKCHGMKLPPGDDKLAGHHQDHEREDCFTEQEREKSRDRSLSNGGVVEEYRELE